MSVTVRELRELDPLAEPETTRQIGREAAAEIERLREVLRAGAVCMSPTERVRWIDRAVYVLSQPPEKAIQE